MSIHTKNVRYFSAVCAVLFSGAVQAANPIVGALGEWKPIIDGRLRYERVEQEPLVREAEAVTTRLRLGAETGRAWGTALLVEGEFVVPLVDDYNDTVRPKPAYPIVADPESYELNRAQLNNTSINNTAITLGRQRIVLDDQRFVGAVGWRQNEQTFDAVRVVNRSVPNLVIDAVYVNRINRVFSHRSAVGVYEGDTFLVNTAYQTPVGKITVFGYFIDIEPIRKATVTQSAAAVRESNATLGVRFAGEQSAGRLKWGYVASYAHQEDYAANPWSFENDYYLGELTVTFRQFSGTLGYEVLDGNGQKGFTTPLATLHRFQGWADKFLATPVNGIEDAYVSVGWTTKGLGPLDTLSTTLVYHDYTSDRLAARAGGDELNLQIMAKWQRVTTLLKYADYNADGLFTDTQKLWVEFGFVW